MREGEGARVEAATEEGLAIGYWLLRDLRDVWKCPSTFREVKHLAFGFRERGILTLRFRHDLGNQKLLGFTSIADSIHPANCYSLSRLVVVKFRIHPLKASNRTSSIIAYLAES